MFTIYTCEVRGLGTFYVIYRWIDENIDWKLLLVCPLLQALVQFFVSQITLRGSQS